MIPLNQRVRVIHGNDVLDEWGLPVLTDKFTHYKVRLDFNAENRIIETETGKNYIFSATIYFKGAVPIRYTDFIEYDNGIDGLQLVNPKQISPITDLSGRVTYVKVIV